MPTNLSDMDGYNNIRHRRAKEIVTDTEQGFANGYCQERSDRQMEDH
jgi:hypothetical protein